MQDAVPEDVVILGINEVGFEGGNEDFCDGRDLAWLQDTVDDDIWGTWDVTYRDIVILDAEGSFHSVFNVTDNDLGDDANFWGLVTALEDLSAAQ